MPEIKPSFRKPLVPDVIKYSAPKNESTGSPLEVPPRIAVFHHNQSYCFSEEGDNHISLFKGGQLEFCPNIDPDENPNYTFLFQEKESASFTASQTAQSITERELKEYEASAKNYLKSKESLEKVRRQQQRISETHGFKKYWLEFKFLFVGVFLRRANKDKVEKEKGILIKKREELEEALRKFLPDLAEEINADAKIVSILKNIAASVSLSNELFFEPGKESAIAGRPGDVIKLRKKVVNSDFIQSADIVSEQLIKHFLSIKNIDSPVYREAILSGGGSQPHAADPYQGVCTFAGNRWSELNCAMRGRIKNVKNIRKELEALIKEGERYEKQVYEKTHKVLALLVNELKSENSKLEKLAKKTLPKGTEIVLRENNRAKPKESLYYVKIKLNTELNAEEAIEKLYAEISLAYITRKKLFSIGSGEDTAEKARTIWEEYRESPADDGKALKTTTFSSSETIRKTENELKTITTKIDENRKAICKKNKKILTLLSDIESDKTQLLAPLVLLRFLVLLKIDNNFRENCKNRELDFLDTSELNDVLSYYRENHSSLIKKARSSRMTAPDSIWLNLIDIIDLPTENKTKKDMVELGYTEHKDDAPNPRRGRTSSPQAPERSRAPVTRDGPTAAPLSEQNHESTSNPFEEGSPEPTQS